MASGLGGADYPLDHAVISVRDRMDAAAALFRRMGFTLTPRGHHRTGSLNHLMVFATDYLELIGFPPGGAHLRPDIAESPIGLDGLVLRPHGAQASYAELVGRGFNPGAPDAISRPIELDGQVHEVRFRTVRLPRDGFAAGRFYFCEQLTPRLVWRREWMRHANGADAIARFTIVTPDPHREAARLGGMLGAAATAYDPDCAEVTLANAVVEFVTAAAHARKAGALACDPADLHGRPRAHYMAMLTLHTDSLDSVRRALDAGGFSATALGSRTVAVPARESMNCTIAFEQ